MTALRQSLADYLSLRRALGYKLQRPEKLLNQFLDFLDARSVPTITTELALAWACEPKAGDPTWWAHRLSIVRGFASYVRAGDAAVVVPPRDLLPCGPRRATPYLYVDADVVALISAADGLRTPLRRATYRTLVGLLAVTGMRIGEAIGLDRRDFDACAGVLLIRHAKFGKTRELPLHPTTVAALRGYLACVDQERGASSACSTKGTTALFVSTSGTRLLYCNVQWTFQRLTREAGLVPRTGRCRPRIHDLRHAFAVNTLLDASRLGCEAQWLTLLPTYLGHVDPVATYWYLSAAPELLALAAERLEQHREGRT